MSGETCGVMRCLRCKGTLERSGREPHRYECFDCKQNYFLVMQLVPVDSDRPVLEAHAERCQGTE